MTFALCFALAACATSAPSLWAPAATGPQPLELNVSSFPSSKGSYRLASDRGAVVLIDVWATWCEPCRDALPAYAELAQRFEPHGVRVYALSIDADDRAVAAFVKGINLKLNVLRDPNGSIAESALKVRLMPTTVLIDKKGFVRFTHEGFSEELPAVYAKEIEQLLAERP